MKLFSRAESKTQADRIKDIQMYSIRCGSANYCEKFVDRKLIASYSEGRWDRSLSSCRNSQWDIMDNFLQMFSE